MDKRWRELAELVGRALARRWLHTRSNPQPEAVPGGEQATSHGLPGEQPDAPSIGTGNKSPDAGLTDGKTEEL